MTIANFEHKLAQYAHLIIKNGRQHSAWTNCCPIYISNSTKISSFDHQRGLCRRSK